MIYQPIENTGEYTTGTVYSEEYVKGLEQEIERLNNIIKEVREKIKLTESKEKFCIKYIQIDRKRYDSIIKLLDKGLDKGE